jgi:pimeloyl-ACP methyl ester carboxylesterase
MSLHHRITGSGPTVVLVHGVCHRGHAWDAVVPLLADRFRLVVVDLPGHGESPGVPGDGDPLPFMADRLAELLAEVTPAGERPHVAGNSLGGFLALEMGARGLAESVTAFSPAGFFRSEAEHRHAQRVFTTLRALARVTAPLVPALSRTAVGRTVFMGVFCARPWRYDPRAMTVDGASIVTNAVVDRALAADFLASEPVDEDLPITVRWGRFDLVLPVGQASQVRRVFPRARVEITPDGHVPMTDDPRGVADAIADTVRRGREHARAAG